MRSTFPRSSLLLLGTNSVHSLVPSTLISQVEALLDSHRIPEAIDLAESQRKKLESSNAIDEDEADELRYVFQRIGFRCFSETRFAEAASSFFNGEMDPRLIISYYPHLRGTLFTSDDSMDVFAGVAEHMPSEASVEDIVVTNLVRNYSPHLPPNTQSSPSTAELRKILVGEANEKLESFLTRWRSRWKARSETEVVAGGSERPKKAINPTLTVVDTVLVKLYAALEKTEALYDLLRESYHVILSEVEETLKKTGQYNALCILYKDAGDEAKLLDVWSKLIDGIWTDEDIKDPLSDMIALLTKKRDRTLIKQWALWLVKRDPDQALKLLMHKDSGKRREQSEEDITMLKAIKEASPAASVQYLEYLIFQRRSLSQYLHTLLATAYVTQMCQDLSQESVLKLWRAKASSYMSNRTQASFLSYFNSTTPDSPHKRTRLKTILFLSGSSLYDVEIMRPLIVEHQKIFWFELAILEGKLNNHHSALTMLVHELHDATSAELYCTLGGDLMHLKLVQSLIEDNPDLEPLAKAFFGIQTKGAVRPSSVDEAQKMELLKILLRVYMTDGEVSKGRAARLINSQAINLDVVDVISTIPADWELNLISSFLARSFRRTLHVGHEAKIVKTISAGQNLEVKDRTWFVLREDGAIIEEAVEDDGDDPGSYSEKQDLTNDFANGLHYLEDIHSEKVESTGGAQLQDNNVV